MVLLAVLNIISNYNEFQHENHWDSLPYCFSRVVRPGKQENQTPEYEFEYLLLTYPKIDWPLWKALST